VGYTLNATAQGDAKYMRASRIVRCSGVKQHCVAERTMWCWVFDLHSLATKDEPICHTTAMGEGGAEFGLGLA
jgi:hypothetical protein